MIKELTTITILSAMLSLSLFAYLPQNTTHIADSLRNYETTSQELKFTEKQLNQIKPHLKTGLEAVLVPEETAWCIKTDGNNTVQKLDINNEDRRYQFKTTVKCQQPTGVIHTHPTVYGAFHPSKQDFENMVQTEKPDCIAHGKITVTKTNEVKGIKCFNNQKQLMKVKKIE